MYSSNLSSYPVSSEYVVVCGTASPVEEGSGRVGTDLESEWLETDSSDEEMDQHKMEYSSKAVEKTLTKQSDSQRTDHQVVKPNRVIVARPGETHAVSRTFTKAP